MKKFAGMLIALGMIAGLLSGCAEAQVQAEESENERIDPIAVNGIDYQSVFGITMEPGSEIVMIAKGNACLLYTSDLLVAIVKYDVNRGRQGYQLCAVDMLSVQNPPEHIREIKQAANRQIRIHSALMFVQR